MAGPRSKDRIAEINVTPMADVVIVLLIICMVTVPMIDEGAVRRLPEATHTRPEERGPVVVSVAADASVFVGDSRMATTRDLSERLGAELLGSRERLV